MSTERDELAEIIQDCGEYIPGSHADDYVSPDKAADAILAAGYRKPRTVTTAAELDALPVGSVVLDEYSEAHQKSEDNFDRTHWYLAGQDLPMRPSLPATVLHEATR